MSMFADDGPVAAKNRLVTYIASNGILSFPEVAQAAFTALLVADVFTALTEGSERLYAALRELEGMPARADALTILGEMAQQYGKNNLNQSGTRGWELHAWAVGAIVDDGGSITPPEVNPTYTFTPPPPPPPPPPID